MDKQLVLTVIIVLGIITPALQGKKVLQDFEKFAKFFKKLINRHFWLSLAIAVFISVLLFYHQSWSSYFEGDEWVFFRFYAPAVSSKFWFVKGFIDTFKNQENLNIHLSPISNMIYVIQYRLFGLNFRPYLASSLVLHVFTSLSVGFFSFRLSKSRTLTVLTTILFALNAPHAQAVTWVVASIYTQLAVFFGFLSLSFLQLFSEKKLDKFLWISLILLLASLWSKETAVMFIPSFIFFFWWWVPSKKKVIKKVALGLGLVLVVFAFTQSANLKQLPERKVFDPQPWVYSIFDSYEQKEGELWLYRFVTFTLKGLSQTIFEHHLIKDLGIWITDLQFPFFNAEKKIGGRTYANFIQTVTPEFISYALALLLLPILIAIGKDKADRKVFWSSLFLFILGIPPILAIILKFPWWGYTSFIDSRHLYHLTPATSMLMALALIKFSNWWTKKAKLPKYSAMFLLTLVVVLINYQWLNLTTKEQQKNSSMRDRKVIVQRLIDEINPVPKKLIIHTTSNRSYYGFAYLMLPFQTAFSHMMPVIFSSSYNPNAHQLPASFFDDRYMKDIPGGLATQGYHSDGEYGFGYFLDEKELIKTLEKEQISPDNVFSFKFDGDVHNLENTTAILRKELDELLASREQFKTWEQYGSEEHFMKFWADPSWNVDFKDNTYFISDQNGLILSIELIEDQMGSLFAQFVSDQVVNFKPVGPDYSTIILKPDLDITRVSYSPYETPNSFYAAAGRPTATKGITYYHFTKFDLEKADLLIRTLDFED